MSRKQPAAIISEESKKDIRNVFQLFDAGSEGYITLQEVGVALRALDLQVQHEEMQQLNAISERAHGRRGVVRFLEFSQLAAQKMSQRKREDELQKAFRLFDIQNDLKRRAVEVGEHLTDEELTEMIAEADANGDGQVSEQDFVRMLRKTERLLENT